MSLLWPAALVGLILIPIAVGAYMVRDRRTSSARTATLGEGYTDVGSSSGWKRHLSPLIGLLALTSLLVGFARPQAVVDVPEFRSTVVLVFDTSQSMIANDVEPTRLDAAKAAATDFVERQPDSVEIGIVSFGSAGAITLRPSDDRSAVLASIDRLQAAGGTSLSEGLFAGLSTIATEPIIFAPDADGNVEIPEVDFGGFGSAIIVMFSDGEDTTEQDPAPLAELAATNGIQIYPVGIGTLEGAELDVDGFTLSSALQDEPLIALAEQSNGEYFSADSLDALADVTESIESDLVINEELLELTSLFGVAAMALLAISAVVAMMTKGRIL